ncbi:hypothetical protein ABPG75_008968 [Micractinium tetrahymenae]
MEACDQPRQPVSPWRRLRGLLSDPYRRVFNERNTAYDPAGYLFCAFGTAALSLVQTWLHRGRGDMAALAAAHAVASLACAALVARRRALAALLALLAAVANGSPWAFIFLAYSRLMLPYAAARAAALLSMLLRSNRVYCRSMLATACVQAPLARLQSFLSATFPPLRPPPLAGQAPPPPPPVAQCLQLNAWLLVVLVGILPLAVIRTLERRDRHAWQLGRMQEQRGGSAGKARCPPGLLPATGVWAVGILAACQVVWLAAAWAASRG